MLMMFLAVALLLPGLCFAALGLASIPSLLAGETDGLIWLAGNVVVGAGLVAAAVFVFRNIGNAGDEDGQ